MSSITLTSKRQATFPVQLCRELNIGPGDVVEVEPTLLAGEQVWVLRPRKAAPRPWLGCLRQKAASDDHSMVAIRASIAAGRRRE